MVLILTFLTLGFFLCSAALLFMYLHIRHKLTSHTQWLQSNLDLDGYIGGLDVKLEDIMQTLKTIDDAVAQLKTITKVQQPLSKDHVDKKGKMLAKYHPVYDLVQQGLPLKEMAAKTGLGVDKIRLIIAFSDVVSNE